jgi:hypothetical protein
MKYCSMSWYPGPSREQLPLDSDMLLAQDGVDKGTADS